MSGPLPIRAGATHKVVVGPFVDKDDGVTPETGITLGAADEAEAILHDNGTVVDISGYTFAAITGADGYYHLTLQSGISDTVGHLTVVIQDDSVCLPVKAEFIVMATSSYDALYSSTPTLLTGADTGLLYESTVGTRNADLSYDMDDSIGLDDIYIGQTCVITDNGDGTVADTGWVSDVDATNDRIIMAFPGGRATRFTTAVGDKIRVYAQRHPLFDINDYDMKDYLLGLMQLTLRNDAAIFSDRSTELGLINADEGSGAGDYSELHSQEGIRVGTLNANVLQISDDATAANNLESAYDGTGYDVGGIDVSELNAVVDDWLNGGRLDTIVDDIKVKTDPMTYTVANELDTNVQSINDVTVVGAGTSLDKWRGA